MRSPGQRQRCYCARAYAICYSWIPAFAGMTGVGVGMTDDNADVLKP